MKIKINKKLVLFTSILILLPSFVGCVFWNQLPEEIPTHFNLLGQADGYNHKMSAIFGLPTLMLLMHWSGILRLSPKAWPPRSRPKS